MTTLVTGGNGFVGAAVVRALLDRGEPVRALVRPDSDRQNLADLDAEIAEGDITIRESLARAMSDCRAVFHVAADYRLWVPDPERMNKTNIEGSIYVVEAAAAAGIDRVVYTSSVAALGLHSDGSPADEQTPVSIEDMIGTYKRSKFQAEAAVRGRARELGLDIVTVNPSTPIGPGDFKPTPTGKIIVDAASGRMPAYVDTGLNWVHVDDVAAGHLLALEKGRSGERYILGGQNLSLREILALIAEQTGRKPPAICLPHWVVVPVALVSEGWARLAAAEPRVSLDGVRMSAKRMYFTSEKAERELGYRSRPAAEAIAAAIRWFREHDYL